MKITLSMGRAVGPPIYQVPWFTVADVSRQFPRNPDQTYKTSFKKIILDIFSRFLYLTTFLYKIFKHYIEEKVMYHRKIIFEGLDQKTGKR